MNRSVLAFVTLLAATSASAQLTDPSRNISGTTANPGTSSAWLRSESGTWTFFHAYDAHVTNVSESGPEEQRTEVFSTNWFAAGVQRAIGDRGFVLLRGRVSAEPWTVGHEDGYPQMLQYVSEQAGGPLVDRMRPHDLIGEAAVHAGWRPTESSLLHLYAAPVGDPALGAAPYALRASGVDFAEAPFAYDLQESWHDSTSVVTAGFATRWISVEGSVFHDAVTFGDHTEIDTGDIDSHSMRITLAPSPGLVLQLSRGELGDDAAQRDVTSASVSYGSDRVALTALWTRREQDLSPSESAFGVEVALRGTRNMFMARAEWVDRYAGFPEPIPPVVSETERTTHLAVGYLFDVIAGTRHRAGVGVNIDYHTQSHELPARYGHKPQSIYLFLRFRSR